MLHLLGHSTAYDYWNVFRNKTDPESSHFEDLNEAHFSYLYKETTCNLQGNL